MKSFDYFLGFGFGLLIALLVWVVFRVARGNKACRYDERQLIDQGKAAKAAFYAWLIYAALMLPVSAAVDPAVFGTGAAMFGGIILSVGVYAIVCILHNAYFNLSDSPRKTILCLAAIGALQFVGAARMLSDGGLFPDGRLNQSGFVSLATGSMILIVLATALVKLAADKRREETDEES